MNKDNEALDAFFNDLDQKEYKRIESKMILAKRIADGIKARHWSKSDFAEKMHQKPSVISKWLSGTHNFTYDTLFDIQELLGVVLINLENVH